MPVKQILKRIRLNLRAMRLALIGRWLTPNDVAASYDALATHYDANWLVHLCRTTDRLHELTSAPALRTIELGCGSGYSTCFLRQNTNGVITAVDISQNMLDQAAMKIDQLAADTSDNAKVEFVRDDMLRFLQRQPDASTDLIFSAWAIGYSVPGKVIDQSYRVLKPGGRLAVIVNRLATMPVVFEAFRKTMRAFPNAFDKAIWPHFPKDKNEIARHLKRNGFSIKLLEENYVAVTPPPVGERLDWLLGTGVLAGFDSVLPLREQGEVRRFFEMQLDQTDTGWEHRYLIGLAVKNELFGGSTVSPR